MNETNVNSDAISALSDIASVTGTYGSLWLSITFAYLTVAYLIGNQMSRFQCVAITALYTISAAVFGIASLGHSHAFFLALEKANTVYDQVWIFSGNPELWFWFAGFFLVGGTSVSLYFMYNVRSEGMKKTERDA